MNSATANLRFGDGQFALQDLRVERDDRHRDTAAWFTTTNGTSFA
jgi:hypothetical protein